MMKENNLGLYLHIPFCKKKCNYCDFLSFECDKKNIMTEYARAISREINILSKDYQFREVDTIYIGGGTPSLLSNRDMGLIMDTLKESFNIDKEAEVAIEVNPATVDEYNLERYLKEGINRLSIGIQSFDNNILSFLGRIHDKNEAINIFQKARKVGFENINLDFIFGIPGQDIELWEETLEKVSFLRPEHISLYSLQIEEGTKLYENYKNGKINKISDKLDREMYHLAIARLKEQGYEHYEYSNVAMPGYRSKHNMKYWSYDEYIGIGLGASSFMNGFRYKNNSNMNKYLDAIKHDRKPIDKDEIEKFTKEEEMGIFVFTSLRKTEGFALDEFREIFNRDFLDVYNKNIFHKYNGLLACVDGRVFLTSKGIDVSNIVLSEFV